jgi:exodeoxyribonuclease VII large subunit
MGDSTPRVYSVGEVLGGVNRMFQDRVGRLWIVGEIKDLRRPASGHAYFTLVDESGQLRAALFRGNARRLAFEPEEGMEVLAYGELSVYEQRGDLQLIVRQLEPRGLGALQQAFEQLRRRLEAEGLFEASRKQIPPERPRRIGVVTSSSGAALHDVLEVTRRRCPGTPLLISPTRVQGPGAEDEIAAALAALSSRDVDVVLLVRGGGSLEDLQPFNTEVVARAIAAFPVPVISGIGHEVDVSIADLVADLRAPTPSAAAEVVAPDGELLYRELEALWGRLAQAAVAHFEQARRRLLRGGDALRAHAPSARLAAHRERWLAAHRALLRTAPLRAMRLRDRLGALSGRLDSLSPLAVLGRGYGLVRRQSDGAIVREVGDAPVGERLAVRVARAEIEAVVDTARPLPEA